MDKICIKMAGIDMKFQPKLMQENTLKPCNQWYETVAFPHIP